ncbi:zinc transporter ZntB [Thalassotalea litorea]|uniref:Zinc transporter ZntB n=1 Tax=Thalassotalea litorea TaxID=2020715 RepID=A0A5R9IFK0_9GAMM|nr:zinc transporter ZntB [Thalassotalea litorea]TLU64315.1 zinc transporter ZntB [Thalassotalea litorea]
MTTVPIEEYDFDLRTQKRRDPDKVDTELKRRWLHLNYANLTNVEQLQDFPLDSVIADALLSEETRPRAQLLENGILLSLRGINLAKNSKPEDMVSVRVFITKDSVLSTGRRKLVALDNIAIALDSNAGPNEPSAWLCTLIANLTDNMAGTVHFIEDTLSGFEDLAIENKETAFQSELANLRRQIIAIRRYLGPQRDALLTLLSDKNKFIDAEHKIEIRESLNHLQLYIEELDLCKERANVLQEEINVNLGQTMNNRMYVLSIVAAIFLPLGFLTGLLGINVGGMPGAENSSAFYLVCLFLLIIALLLTIILKKSRWL